MQIRCSYLICSIPQSGSLLLGEALKKTGIAGHPKEYFDMVRTNTQSELYSKPSSGPRWSKVWEARTYAHYLAEVIEEGTSSNGIFGAHVMGDYFDDFVCSLRLIPAYGDLPVSDLLSTLFPNLHYVWVTRRDKVQHAIALWRAFQREMWMYDDALPSRIGPAFHSEVVDHLVQQIVAKEEDWWKFFEACHIEPFTVVYEELTHAIERTVRDVLRYLQIPTADDMGGADWRANRPVDALSGEWEKRYHVLRQAQQPRLPA
jgi:trehalose 2-sulfotransferase